MIFLILRRVLFSLLLIGFIALGGAIWMWKTFITAPLTEKSQIIYVPPGSSINAVSRTLHARGLLSHPIYFILLARFQGQTKRLKAGEYELEPGITPNQLLTKLATGKVILRHFTIVEGWTLKQVFVSINSNRYLTHTIPALSLLDISQKIGANTQLFEGTFYPDTYLFAAGVPDVTILKKAFWMMQRNLDSLWQKRALNLPYNDPYSALIVASLIEKETARPEERAQIAGVIVRRLEKRMLLQIDASVIYGLGETYSGKLTRDDLQKDTPYNTYLHTGLPPTPIAMPSLASVVAALHPAPGTSLYYVARGDGSHEFTNSLEEHHNAVKKFHIKHLEFEEEEFKLVPVVPWFNNPNLDQVNLLSN